VSGKSAKQIDHIWPEAARPLWHVQPAKAESQSNTYVIRQMPLLEDTRTGVT
jgi:hypothetical protein